MLITLLLAATLFGYAVGMIVGLKVQFHQRPQLQERSQLPLEAISETKIEHPAAIHPGVRRLHTFIKPY